MPKSDKTAETVKSEQKSAKTAFTKADYLTAIQFAKKHNLEPNSVTEIVRQLYKKGTLLSNITHAPAVSRNRTAHTSTMDSYLLIHPLATELIIKKYKTKE